MPTDLICALFIQSFSKFYIYIRIDVCKTNTEYIKYIEPQTVLLINTHYIFEAIRNVFNSLSVSNEYGIVSDLILKVFTRLFEVLIL